MQEVKELNCASIVQEALLGEAEAVRNYSKQLAEIYALDRSIGDICAPIIKEIIEDELDHEARLRALYKIVGGVK